MAKLGTLPVQFLGFGLDGAAEDVEDALDLLLRATPVLGRERPEGEVANADFPRRVGNAADILGACLMALEAGEAALVRPPPVAIHDDGDMARHARGIDRRACRVLRDQVGLGAGWNVR